MSYFVSYYDYYQPEAYIPQRDIYIEKDASINEEIDRLRLATTSSLVSRRDVIVVASVSCIYGLGSPEDYKAMMVGAVGGRRARPRRRCSAKLVDIQYERNDTDPSRGKFRVRGDSVEIWPSYEEFAYRHRVLGRRGRAAVDHQPDDRRGRSTSWSRCTSTRPSTSCCRRSGFTTRSTRSARSCASGSSSFKSAGQAARGPAAERPDAVRHRDDDGDGLLPGDRELQPAAERAASRASRRTRCSTSFPKDYLLFVDESHATVPQVGAMYAGDRSRKVTLVEHGFRLPSALDNRPLKFDEWRERIDQVRLRLGDAGERTSWSRRAAKSSSRSCGRRGCSIR